MWGNWKQEKVSMVTLVPFDLTNSRGLSWSSHNSPDLSTVFSWRLPPSQSFHGNIDRSFSPTHFVFLPLKKSMDGFNVYLANVVSLFAVLLNVPLIPPQSFSWLKPVAMPHTPSFVWPQVKACFWTLAVILTAWGTQPHSGLYWLKYIIVFRRGKQGKGRGG